MAGTPKKDAISGQSTTGHEWDGISELNTPLPKWWVYVFYVTIIWSIGYVVVYPALPFGNSFSPGMFGFSARATLEKEVASARDAHKDVLAAIGAQDVAAINGDAKLRSYALAGGAVLFKENCAACHQSGGQGAMGYPTLADDEWLWGGTLDDIKTTITHGIRSTNDPDTRIAEMPAFGRDQLLTADEIKLVSAYVASTSSGTATAGPGQDLYVNNCASCHSSDSANPVSDGNAMMGAPALANKIWLYAGPGKDFSAEQIAAQVTLPKHSVMPAWGGRLTETDIKMLTVYVHGLGGGK